MAYWHSPFGLLCSRPRQRGVKGTRTAGRMIRRVRSHVVWTLECVEEYVGECYELNNVGEVGGEVDSNLLRPQSSALVRNGRPPTTPFPILLTSNLSVSTLGTLPPY